MYKLNIFNLNLHRRNSFHQGSVLLQRVFTLKKIRYPDGITIKSKTIENFHQRNDSHVEFALSIKLRNNGQ